MMQYPFISIIIPTYNAEKTIQACMESIIRQTYQHYEVLVIDGLSSDDTIKIIRHYADRYPSIRWISEKDMGIYDAMNKGIAMAKGAWLYFLGSDDEIYDPDVFMNVFKKLWPPQTLIVYGKALVIPDQWITPLNNTFDDVVKANLCHQSIFYSKNVFKKWKYDLRLKTLADWDLNLKLFAHYRQNIISVDVVICRFLNLGVSAAWRSSEEYKKHFASRNRVYIRYLSLPDATLKIFKGKVAGLLRSIKSMVK